jgi:hypothetical protein
VKHIRLISCRPQIAQDLPGSAKWTLVGSILSAVSGIFDVICIKGVCANVPDTSSAE